MSGRSARPLGAHEALIAHQLDRIIQSASMRIEQQCIHIQESAGSPRQMTSARAELDRMIQVLEKLTGNRAKFAFAAAEMDVDVAAVTTHRHNALRLRSRRGSILTPAQDADHQRVLVVDTVEHAMGIFRFEESCERPTAACDARRL